MHFTRRSPLRSHWQGALCAGSNRECGDRGRPFTRRDNRPGKRVCRGHLHGGWTGRSTRPTGRSNEDRRGPGERSAWRCGDEVEDGCS